jgi:hypothetical protein
VSLFISTPSSARPFFRNHQVYPTSNLASAFPFAHNAAMAFTQLFLGFLQPVAVGSATVFALFVVIGLKTPRRSPVLITRRTTR